MPKPEKTHIRNGCPYALNSPRVNETWDGVTCAYCLAKKNDDFTGVDWYYTRRYMPDGTCPCGCRKEVPHGHTYASTRCQKRHYNRRARRKLSGACFTFGIKKGKGYKVNRNED